MFSAREEQRHHANFFPRGNFNRFKIQQSSIENSAKPDRQVAEIESQPQNQLESLETMDISNLYFQTLQCKLKVQTHLLQA